MRPYSIPLWTIFTKCPDPTEPREVAELRRRRIPGAPARARGGRGSPAPAMRRWVRGARTRPRPRPPSGRSPARARTPRRSCRSPRSGSRAAPAPPPAARRRGRTFAAVDHDVAGVQDPLRGRGSPTPSDPRPAPSATPPGAARAPRRAPRARRRRSRPSFARVSTARGSRSVTTQVWPSRISRREMLAPIRPSPTTPSCIGRSLVIGPPSPIRTADRSIERDSGHERAYGPQRGCARRVRADRRPGHADDDPRAVPAAPA